MLFQSHLNLDCFNSMFLCFLQAEDGIRVTRRGREFRRVLFRSKKKDDLADTVMQALSFVNRVEVIPASKKKKTRSKSVV